MSSIYYRYCYYYRPPQWSTQSNQINAYGCEHNNFLNKSPLAHWFILTLYVPTTGALHMSDQTVNPAVKCLDSRHLTARLTIWSRYVQRTLKGRRQSCSWSPNENCSFCGYKCTSWDDILSMHIMAWCILAVCLADCAKVVSATSSEGFLAITIFFLFNNAKGLHMSDSDIVGA